MMNRSVLEGSAMFRSRFTARTDGHPSPREPTSWHPAAQASLLCGVVKGEGIVGGLGQSLIWANYSHVDDYRGLPVLLPPPSRLPARLCASCPLWERDFSQACHPSLARFLGAMARWEEGETEAFSEAQKVAEDSLEEPKSMVLPTLLPMAPV